MPDPQPSNRRLSRAAITIIALVVVAAAAVFIAYQIFYIRSGP